IFESVNLKVFFIFILICLGSDGVKLMFTDMLLIKAKKPPRQSV
ncbi:MAG: hypothetical protein ACD_75C00897G0001, partial [uncultured bacterium]